MSKTAPPSNSASPSPEEKILYETRSDGRIAYITLNNPRKLNAVDKDMTLRFLTVLKAADQDNKVIVIVIKSTGDRAFCAGWDLAMAQDKSPEMKTFMLTKATDISRTIAFLKKPVIAEIQGSAVGTGCFISFAADFRFVARKEGLFFLLPEIAVGLPGATGPTVQSIAALGLPRAKQMIVAGEKISLETMDKWGLITKVCEPDKLDEEVDKFCQGFLDKQPILVFTQKVLCSIMGMNLMKKFYDLENETADYINHHPGKDAPADMDAFIKGLWSKYGAGHP